MGINANFKNLREVALVFLKLGITSFGGPLAHIAIMEKEVVVKRKWLTRDYFLDLVSATNLIPGPNSTEMAIHCGYQRAGVWGLWVAGFCFILPAVLITLIFAWFYKVYGNFPAIGPIFLGIKPVVIIIILDAIFKFGKKALKNVQLGIIGFAVLVGTFLGINEIILLILSGLLGIIWFTGLRNNIKSVSPLLLVNFTSAIPGISSVKLFWIFLKIGAVLFGSGYVLFAYLDGELVQKLGWLSRHQLMDAIAVGQFTPGPVLSTSTFIGYEINGLTGALLATLGIFLPAFIFVLILNPFIAKLRKSRITSAFLDSVNIASVALMIAVTFQMCRTSLVDWKSCVIAAIAFLCLYGFRVKNTIWLILGGASLGYLLNLL